MPLGQPVQMWCPIYRLPLDQPYRCEVKSIGRTIITLVLIRYLWFYYMSPIKCPTFYQYNLETDPIISILFSWYLWPVVVMHRLQWFLLSHWQPNQYISSKGVGSGWIVMSLMFPIDTILLSNKIWIILGGFAWGRLQYKINIGRRIFATAKLFGTWAESNFLLGSQIGGEKVTTWWWNP